MKKSSSKNLSAEDAFKLIVDSLYAIRSAFDEIDQLTDNEIIEVLKKLATGKNLTKRQDQLVTKAKMIFAVVSLTEILGFPPHTKDVAKAINMPYHKVSRLLRNEEFMVLSSIILVPFTKTGMVKVKEKADVTTLRWKHVGKDYRGRPKKPGPLNLIVYLKLHPFDRTPLQPDEKPKLREYLRESFFIKVYKTTRIRILRSGCRLALMLINNREMLQLLCNELSLMGERNVCR